MAQQGYGQQPQPIQQQKPEKYAKIGGILIIVGSVFGLIFGLFYAIVGTAVLTAGVAEGFLCYLPLGLSIVGIIGGVMAVKKSNFIVAIVGGILGFLSVGFVLGSVLSLVGLILVAISKQDFEEDEYQTAPGPQQWQQQQQQPQQLQQPQQQPPQQQPQQQDQQPDNTCPDCSSEIRYIDEYDRWYCDNCKDYK